MENVTEDEMRMAAVRSLEEKGYKVLSTTKGQGVPKFSRLEIEKKGRKETCAVKVTRGGRISFTRNPDGSYKVLGDVTYVVHVTPDRHDSTKVWVTLFDRTNVIAAFDANYRALSAKEMAHIPSWVNPESEAGWRLTGSGFKNKAIWTEQVPLTSALATSSISDQAISSNHPSQEEGVMNRIKAILSEHMGVPPNLIDVEVRVRL